jgi:uncharacterized protein
MRFKSILLLTGVLAGVTAPGTLFAQNTDADLPPVIDVHVHAMLESFPGGGPMCPNTPKFQASDPDTKEGMSGWSNQTDCTPKLYPAEKGEYLHDLVAEMKRLNVTAVVFGDPASVEKYKQAAPGRVIPGTSFNGPKPGERLSVEDLRKLFTTGGFKVMGEIGLQYEGLSPSDPSVDKYFALAEQWIFRWRFTWVREVRDAPILHPLSFGAPWAIRFYWKICSHGILNCAFKSCMPAIQ